MQRGWLAQARCATGAGDTLVVWKLDRLGCLLGFLRELVARLGKQGAGVHVLPQVLISGDQPEVSG